ncbi:MAG: Gfo/Idh/MocA family oxidoreductase [Clostridia bacterium]|nr:Gfo/Idh/MocA family oxidoreductase [Clostridia bacterium]
MGKIRIAQIGTSQNSHGSDIWNTLKIMLDVFEMVGYAFPENEREKFPIRAKDFDGYREMSVEEILSDPSIDAVLVETEEIYLTKYALMVARAGKHLHMEKPGGVDIDEFRELVCMMKEKRLVFSLGYMYRFNPKIREVLERVKSGELGKIFSVEAHMSCKHPKAMREWLSSFPGGMMFFLGCHLVDLIYQIKGEPTEVIPLSCSSGIDGLNTSDIGMAVFKYPDGVSFAKASDNELGGFMRRRLVICGEKKTIEICPLEVQISNDSQYAAYRECSSADWCAEGELQKSEVHHRYLPMMQNFAELICGKENPYTYDYELRLYELILRSCGCAEV